MGLSGHEVLDIIELIYYVPALCLSIWVVRKHGLGRQLGWIFLAILAILRIVGASTGIAAANHPSIGLITTSLICYGIGLSPLLLALQGILLRANDAMQRGQGLSARLIHVVALPILTGLVLGIVAGTKEFSSDPSTVNTGYALAKAASMLFLLGFLLLAGITVVTFAKRANSPHHGERHLIFAALLSLPFLAVRIIYAILVSFDHTSSAFNFRSTRNTSIIVQAIMSLAMEFVVVAIYLAAGLAVDAIPQSAIKEESVVEQRHQRYQRRHFSPLHNLSKALQSRTTGDTRGNARG